MARSLPQFDELVTLTQACVRNASDLLADARMLLAAERAPRSHALATLAFEEIGKAFICVLAVAPVPEPFFGFRGEGDFWVAWNSHTDKLTWARGFLSLLVREPGVRVTEAVGRLVDSTRADHLRKMRGLYVDYSDGSVLVPSEVTVAEAAQLASDVQAVLDLAEQVWCRDDMRERLREVCEVHPDEFRDLMARASEALVANPDTAVGVVRQMLQDGLRAGQDTDGQGTEPSTVDA